MDVLNFHSLTQNYRTLHPHNNSVNVSTFAILILVKLKLNSSKRKTQ